MNFLTITSILLQFRLQIRLITRINPFSGCSLCLEASQVVCDANRLTGFSVMGISFGGSSRAICKIIFFVNKILLLLPVLRLAQIFFMFMVYLVFFTLYCFSTLVCANLVGRFLKVLADLPVLIFDRRLLTQFLGLYGRFWPFFCWLERHVFSKMLVNLIQYLGTVGIFNSKYFVFGLKHKI